MSDIIPLLKKTIKHRYFKRIKYSLIALLSLYLLLISPIFFMYPNHDNRIRKNITKDYFDSIAVKLEGDCYRVSHNFALECPFPTREVHLASEHTIVEILINDKWYAYDPLFQIMFENSVVKTAFDVNRGYIPEYLEDYEYILSFREFKFYHSYYFVFLKYICPFYDRIMMRYYSIV